MTLPIPLVPLPGAGTGRGITGYCKPPALLLLALSVPPAPASALQAGHHAQPAPPDGRSGLWLRTAAAGLGVLAAAAAAVSFSAQYRMVDATRNFPAIAALEAAISDAAALVFASLGIAWRCTAAAPSGPGR